MAKNITTNGTTSFAGVNAGKVARVTVLGTWSNATITAQIQNGNTTATWTNHPTNAAKTANHQTDYPLGDTDGIQLVTTDAEAATDLWASVTERT